MDIGGSPEECMALAGLGDSILPKESTYDQFVTEQIAGDLIPNANRDQISTASIGYIRKVEGGSVPEEFRIEYVADRVHTGRILGCNGMHPLPYQNSPVTRRITLSAFFNNIDEAGSNFYRIITQLWNSVIFRAIIK